MESVMDAIRAIRAPRGGPGSVRPNPCCTEPAKGLTKL